MSGGQKIRKGKAHKHKQIFLVTGGGGSPDRVARGLPTGGQGSKVYVLCAERKEHKHFCLCTRPGGSVTGVTEKLFMCQMSECAKGAAKASCAETVVQKGVFGESVSSLPP